MIAAVPDQEPFCVVLRRRRRERGYSIRGLASAAEVDYGRIWRLERGSKPNEREIGRLSAVLDAEEDEETEALRLAGVQRGSREHLRDFVRFAADPVAREAVRVHRGGLTGDQIAAVLGLGHATVERDCASAFAKLLRASRQNDEQGRLTREWLSTWQTLRAEREARAV